MEKTSIGILLISTWKYNKFIDPIVSDIKKYLFPRNDTKIYLHTDSTESHHVDKIIKIDHQPWPLITLNRFKTFYNNRQEYDTDYLFYLDIDCKIISVVDNDILSDFVVVQHHWYMGTKGTPETNPKSLAFIDPKKFTIYVAGAFFGGTKKRFINVAKELSDNIETDLQNDIIAVWHDESHLNKYFTDHINEIKLISPEYMYSPSNKKNYFAHPKIIPFKNDQKGFNKFEDMFHK